MTENTGPISQRDMAVLIEHGSARPLVAGYPLVPVRHAHQWWYVPTAAASDAPYVAADPDRGEEFDDLEMSVRFPEPPTSAAELAEWALIGALVADSGRVRDVRDWLRMEDLKAPAARVIYQILADLDREGRGVPVTELPAAIVAARCRWVTAMDLHFYMQVTPVDSSNHVIYARQVLEAAARYIVAVSGSCIEYATERSHENPDLGPGDIQATLAAERQRLAELGERLRRAQGSSASLITAAPVPDPAEFQSPWPPAPPLDTRVISEAEREVLASCLTDPAVRVELLGCLTPDDFSHPRHAATWAAFGALADAGTPIDYVTVAWECQRHNPDYDSPGLPADQLFTMTRRTLDAARDQVQAIAEDITSGTSSMVSSVEGVCREAGVHPSRLTGATTAVRTIAHASLLRHTDAALNQVQAIAEDGASGTLTVVSTAERAYREAGFHASRLTGATTAVRRASAALAVTNTPPDTPPCRPAAVPTPLPEESTQRDHTRRR
ncbi:MAG: DnaB-like helicase N-terminal domain-containing protein [Mycobacteriales bacterium]